MRVIEGRLREEKEKWGKEIAPKGRRKQKNDEDVKEQEENQEEED